LSGKKEKKKKKEIGAGQRSFAQRNWARLPCQIYILLLWYVFYLLLVTESYIKRGFPVQHPFDSFLRLNNVCYWVSRVKVTEVIIGKEG
jgi:hypothetical protein